MSSRRRERVRHAKGVNFVGLVKMLKVHARDHSLAGLDAGSAALMQERILMHAWYPLEHLLAMLELTYGCMLQRDPQKALAMGLAGGKQVWSATHRAFVAGEDAASNLLSMRHTWANYFDFGSLLVEPEGPRSVRFTVVDYPDVPEVHGMTIAGWHLAVAHLSGSTDARVELLEQPWRGGSRQVHRVVF